MSTEEVGPADVHWLPCQRCGDNPRCKQAKQRYSINMDIMGRFEGIKRVYGGPDGIRE
jgi:hypothetical protein